MSRQYRDPLRLASDPRPIPWGGALEAVVEARAEGLTRFIGVTGHGWTIASMHRRSLERFDFDSVLMPWNLVMSESERYRADFDARPSHVVTARPATGRSARIPQSCKADRSKPVECGCGTGIGRRGAEGGPPVLPIPTSGGES